MEKIKFQTYAWSYGTTSFRVSQLKYKIERQLIKLKELRAAYPNKDWKDLQEIYFEMLVEEGLAKKTSKDKSKDARQKTSPLFDLGLIDNERRLTETGEKLYKINYNKAYNFNNLFFLRNDAYLYFKQLLKINFDESKRYYKDFNINPLLSLIYLLLKLNSIPKNVFMYAFSICQNFDDVLKLEKFLKENNSNFNVYEYLKSKIKEKHNYKMALTYFKRNDKNLKTFEIVLIDRKSKRNAEIFLELYNELKTFNNSKNKFEKLKTIINKFGSSKLKTEFRKRLYLNNFNNFKNLKLEKDDKSLFYFFHTSKWKVNLEDYYDLNKRFIELSEVIIFENENIYLDELVKLYFEDLFNDKNDYYKLSLGIEFNENYLSNKIKNKYNLGKNINLRDYIKQLKLEKRKKIFDNLIKNKFSNDKLIELLTKIKKREDKNILSYAEWDADIPTIFEYLIGIIFYKVTKTINLDFLNMNLNASMLPIRFASGNKADIIFKFENIDMIIEVTLTTDENQRRMELEPVIRHIGKYNLQQNKAFGIFIAPYLDPNVLVVFRAYKNLNFYDIKDYQKVIKGLEILPLSIDEIVFILKNNLDFQKFLLLKEQCINDKETDGVQWYSNVIKKAFNEV